MAVFMAALAAARVHIPIIWVIGGILFVGGLVAMFRGRVFFGILLMILGVILGAINLLVFL